MAIGISTVVAAIWVPDPTVQWILYISAGTTFFLSLCFRNLTVRDEGENLLISFGPIPLFHRRIPYNDVESVEQARSTVLDGWGIHLSPSGGWTWNIWGFDCVDVRLARRRKIRIGTDDPAGLSEFLKRRAITADR